MSFNILEWSAWIDLSLAWWHYLSNCTWLRGWSWTALHSFTLVLHASWYRSIVGRVPLSCDTIWAHPVYEMLQVIFDLGHLSLMRDFDFLQIGLCLIYPLSQLSITFIRFDQRLLIFFKHHLVPLVRTGLYGWYTCDTTLILLELSIRYVIKVIQLHRIFDFIMTEISLEIKNSAFVRWLGLTNSVIWVQMSVRWLIVSRTLHWFWWSEWSEILVLG